MFYVNYKQEKKHFLLIRACVYLVLSAGQSISRFLRKSPDFWCFEDERSADGQQYLLGTVVHFYYRMKKGIYITMFSIVTVFRTVDSNFKAFCANNVYLLFNKIAHHTGDRSFSGAALRLWNTLPESIRNTNDIHQF